MLRERERNVGELKETMRPKSGKEREREKVVKLSKKLVETCSNPNVEKISKLNLGCFCSIVKKNSKIAIELFSKKTLAPNEIFKPFLKSIYAEETPYWVLTPRRTDSRKSSN